MPLLALKAELAALSKPGAVMAGTGRIEYTITKFVPLWGNVLKSAPYSELASPTGRAAIRSIIVRPALLMMCPKTVKPPFWPSSCEPLFARLKNHWLVALFGLPSSFAIAMVPRVLLTLNSFCTAGFWGIATGRLLTAW